MAPIRPVKVTIVEGFGGSPLVRLSIGEGSYAQAVFLTIDQARALVRDLAEVVT